MKANIGVIILITMLGAACSSSGTSSNGSAGGVGENTGSAIAAVFGSSAQAAISSQQLAAVVKHVEQDSTPTTCESLSDDPASVNSLAIDPDFQSDSVTSKDYGPTGNAVTLTESDFCEDANGQSNSGDELFAYFSLTSDVEANCDDGSTATMLAGSEGVWYQDGTGAACPEIYGQFNMRDQDDNTFTANCHMLLSCAQGSSEIVEATCTDENGSTLSLDSDLVCEINAN